MARRATPRQQAGVESHERHPHHPGDLPPHHPQPPLTPKICRDSVGILLATNGHAPGLADTARTLVSELVTNAVLHTTSPTIDIETAVLSDGVRVAVYDDSPAAHLVPLAPAWDGECGRGLLLVQALAQAWGVATARPYGRKHVWFELRSGTGG
ncbi:ATP-binding protein [Streptomyces avermitilis]|uniref:ATP-binding protein n=1 Tax=Streptomyces avermitilis TaxID=33903 RepID=UPI00340B148D